MAAKTGELKFIIKVDNKDGSAKITKLSDKVDELGKTTEKNTKTMKKGFSSTWKQMALGQIAFSVLSQGLKLLSSQIRDSLNLFTEQEQAERLLSVALENTAGNVDITLESLKEYASELQQLTTVGDEASLKLMKLALNMGVAKTEIKEATKSAIGLSKSFGIDLNASMKIVAQTLAGDYNLLKRYSAELRTAATDTERATITQSIFAKGFEQAKEEAETFGGAIQQLSNSFGDLKEKAGEVFAKALLPYVKDLQKVLTSQDFTKDIDGLKDSLVGVVVWVRANKGEIFDFLKLLAAGVKEAAEAASFWGKAFSGKREMTAQRIRVDNMINAMQKIEGVKKTYKDFFDFLKKNEVDETIITTLRLETEALLKDDVHYQKRFDGFLDFFNEMSASEKGREIQSLFNKFKYGTENIGVSKGMRDVLNHWGKNKSEILKSSKEVDKYIKIIKEAGSDAPRSVSRILRVLEMTKKKHAETARAEEAAIVVTKEHAKELKKIQKEFDKLNKEINKNTDYIVKLDKETEDFITTTKEVTDSVKGEAEDINYLTEQMQKQNDEVERSIAEKEGLIGIIFKISDKMNQYASALASVSNFLNDVGILSDATSEKLTKVADETIRAAQGAATFAEGYASGDVGKMVGGALEFFTGVTTAIASVFGTANKGIKEAIDREREFIDVSGEMEDKLIQMAKVLGDTHLATSALLVDIIKAADITTGNIEGYWERARGILSDYQRGAIDATQATKGMGETFAELVKEAKRLGTEGSKAMIQFILDSKAAGLNIKEVADYINEKLNTGVDALNRRLKTLASGGKLLKGEFGRLSRFTRDMFNALISEGADYIDVVAQMQDSLLSLSALAEEKGKKIKGDLADMIDLAKFLDANKLLIDKIKDTKIMMDALAHAGKLTGESFGDFQTSAKRQFDELIKRELSTEDALRLMMPTLRDLQKMADAYGLTLDATTQAMIDQAKEAGLSFEAQKTDAEIQTDLMQQQLDVLKAIAKVFGVDIPNGIDATTDAVQGMAQAVADVDWDQFYQDRGFGTGGGHVPGGGPGDYRPPGFANGTGGNFITPPSKFLVGEQRAELMEMRNGKMKVTPLGSRSGSDAAPRIKIINKIEFKDLKISNRSDKDEIIKGLRSVMDSSYRDINSYMRAKLGTKQTDTRA